MIDFVREFFKENKIIALLFLMILMSLFIWKYSPDNMKNEKYINNIVSSDSVILSKYGLVKDYYIVKASYSINGEVYYTVYINGNRKSGNSRIFLYKDEYGRIKQHAVK